MSKTKDKAAPAAGAATPAPDLTPAQLAAKVRGHVADNAADQAKLNAEKADLEERNLLLLRLPLRPEEALTYALAKVDAEAAKFMPSARWNDQISALLKPKGYRPPVHHDPSSVLPDAPVIHGGPLNMADVKCGKPFEAIQMRGFLGEGSEVSWENMQRSALYFFLGAQIKAQITARFAALAGEWPTMAGNTPDGLTIAQREAEIERNDARIAEIEHELDELAALAAELTVSTGPAPVAAHYGRGLSQLREMHQEDRRAKQ